MFAISLLTRLLWQPTGVEKILPLGNLTDYEKQLIAAAVPELATNIEKVWSSTSLSSLVPPAYSRCRVPRSKGRLLPKYSARMVQKWTWRGLWEVFKRRMSCSLLFVPSKREANKCWKLPIHPKPGTERTEMSGRYSAIMAEKLVVGNSVACPVLPTIRSPERSQTLPTQFLDDSLSRDGSLL